MKKVVFLFFLLCCIAETSYGQLSNFALTLTKRDESCTGNGSLSFTVSNTTAGSTIIYRIYKLPDVVNTIAVVSTNTFGGLTSGTYRVIATQTLGNASGTQQQDIIIADTRNLITYQVSSTAINCDTGTINVNVLTGNPSSYEIVSGPIIVAPQPSNSFTNLPGGTYNIRVNDACGEGLVQTYTLTFSNPPNLVIGSPVVNTQLTSCNTVGVSYAITTNPATSSIRYPLTAQITIFPPANGTPVIQNQTITTGSPSSVSISNIIPFYPGQVYTYNIKIIDACGNVYSQNGNQINLQLAVRGAEVYINCHKGIDLTLLYFLPPYTVTFLSAPAGFNPSTYNANHPGPFTSALTEYISTTSSEISNGTYNIQVTDACNRTATCQVIVRDVEPLYEIKVLANSCDVNNFIQIPLGGSAGLLISTATITSSTANLGNPIPYNVTPLIVGGVLLMPLPPGTYTIQGLDICGRPYSYTFTMPPKIFSVDTTPTNIIGCAASNSLGSIRVDSVGSLLASIIIRQAPTTFTQTHTLPFDTSSIIPPTGSYSVRIESLPAGTYTLDITDRCGNNYIRVVTITATPSQDPLIFFDKKGCGENFDSIALVSPNGGLQIVRINAAPSSFPFVLPYDVSFNIAGNGIFYMNSLPEGRYTFYTKDICGIEKTTTYDLIGYHRGVDGIQVISNCGSFDLDMNFTDNTINQIPSYWLQKYNPITNQWAHPLTGVVYPNNSVPNFGNSYRLNNSAINYNIATTGTFRILITFGYYSNGSSATAFCVQNIKTFDYTGDLKIVSAYAIPCVNGGSQVFIIATGAAPLQYKITTKNGLPFLIDNGTSNSFASLQPGTYNFRVQDVCGNIVNRLFDINILQEPEIASSNLCAGSNGQLSVQPFSFLNYEWWKDNNTTTILSTTNTLNFTPFTNADAGIYHVRIYSTTLNSCVDRVLNFTISPAAAPNAGLDGLKVICGSTIAGINLFTILNGTFNVGGTWQEITSSGTLIGNNWYPQGLPLGTYIFKYTVNGFCNTSDDSLVTITLKEAVEVPVVIVDASYCPGQDIEFSIQAIPNAVYEWSGPNNFTSSLQNPTITNATAVNAGTYTIKAIIGECDAQSSVVINNKPTPEYIYKKGCDGGIFKVEIIPSEGSVFDPTSATYSWTGPNNFTSTSNPLILTSQPKGDYSVVVTNNEGCFSPQTIEILSTFCDFPNVITPGIDGNNDTFDLTNYDVSLFQVFSRWGRLVYEQNNYTNQWYGQNMHGGLLPDSTYYYFVRLRNGEEKHGWIFVGRG